MLTMKCICSLITIGSLNKTVALLNDAHGHRTLFITSICIAYTHCLALLVLNRKIYDEVVVTLYTCCLVKGKQTHNSTPEQHNC